MQITTFKPNLKTYGQAITINKKSLRFVLSVFVVITPFTLWLLVFIPKIENIKLRF